MKKLLLSLAFVGSSIASFAQIGAVAPDFTVVDINGNSHNLYTYLNAGKVVLLDVSATWCGPCWGFHNAHYLEDLYAEFGPAGTNEVVVLFYEGDATTAANALNGTGGSTQGDWVTGTPYPIINETPVQLNLNIYAPLGFPTINVICPSDKKIKWDLWDSQVAGNIPASLTNMRNKVNEVIDQCVISTASISENEIINSTAIYPNPVGTSAQIQFSTIEKGNAVIEVMDLNGKIVSTIEQSAIEGDNTISFSAEHLEKGTYMVKITLNGSEKRISFVKM